METTDPSRGAGLLSPDDDPVEPVQVVPPVVAVLVTSNPGPWLEDALASLAAQEYPALSVLVLDDGSDDDPTPRIAAAMPNAFVRRLEPNRGFAAAANEAITAVEGATFLLFCHDDVIFEADALQIMVEEAYRSNAGIVGPKLVDYDRPRTLLEVGMAIDHYGVPFSGIEPGELDQEQHDAVRDVFFVATAAMLVRADLCGELGGFDAATFPGADDLDLCWRARLAGARVLVAPDARVRHRRATARENRTDRNEPPDDTRARTRSRVRVLMKSYSGVALVWVLPLAFALDVLESIALLFTRRPKRARAVMGGWWINLKEFGDVRRARREAQRLRRVGDGDVRVLMVRGSARIRTFMTMRLHAGDRLSDMSERTRVVASEAGSRLRRLDAVLAVVLGLLLFFGSRVFIFDRISQVGAFNVWPGAGPGWGAFFAAWRDAMLGANQPAPTAMGLVSSVTTLLFGDAALARTLVIVAAYPLGAYGVYRLVRPFAQPALPAVVAALAYAANPVARNAIAEGRLGPLMLYAFAPFILRAFVRAGDDDGDTEAATSLFAGMNLRSVLGATLLTAIVAAFWPPALFFPVLVALAFLVAAPLVGGLSVALRAGVFAALTAAAAFLLLLPWSFSLIGADPASFGLFPRDPLALRAVLEFHTGPSGGAWGAWGLVVAAVLPLAVATGTRFAWAGRAWTLAALSFAGAWLPSRISVTAPVPAPEGLLVGAALGLAFAIGLGVAAFLEDLPTFHFGWRQIVAVAAALGIALPFLGLAGDTTTGRWNLPAHDWSQEFDWLASDTVDGAFRVLWLGDATVLPTGAKETDGVGYGLTKNGLGDARSQLPPPTDHAGEVLARAIDLAHEGRTTRLGHLLAPAGVRYIAVLRRAAPDAGQRGRPLPALEAGLADQLDLTRRSDASAGDAVLYENEAWVPVTAVVPPGVDVPSDPPAPLAAANETDLSGAQGVVDGSVKARGTVLLSEASNADWHASIDGEGLERDDAFGWTNAFAADRTGQLDTEFRGGQTHRALTVLDTLLWIVAVAGWFWLRPSRRARRGARREREGARAGATRGRPNVSADDAPAPTPADAS